MGGAHSHRADHRALDAAVEVGRMGRAVLLGILALAAAITLVAGFVLWPDGDEADRLSGSVAFAAEGVTFGEGTITAVGEGAVTVEVEDGPEAGESVEVADIPSVVLAAGLEPGDRLELSRTPSADGSPATYSFFGVERDRPLVVLLVIFAVVVVVVARFRGLMALVGLAVAGVIVWQFVLPAILTGEPAVPVVLVGATVIMYVVLYTTHGISLRTSAALLGTLAGVLVTAAVGWWSVGSTNLAGLGDEAGGRLSTFVPGIDLQGVVLAAVVIAGLGVLNDVTITQASAVWELREAGPSLSRVELFLRAMRIGRDHIASTIYTIVFAYAGMALTVLLVVQLYDRPLYDLVGTEEIATEVVRSLAGSIGLVLAVPLTTAIAALTVAGPRSADGAPLR